LVQRFKHQRAAQLQSTSAAAAAAAVSQPTLLAQALYAAAWSSVSNTSVRPSCKDTTAAAVNELVTPQALRSAWLKRMAREEVRD
jgi:hypothetical protein